MSEHQMRMAFVSPKVARRRGLNKNHHLRVWCECMSGQISEPGSLPNGLYYREDRSPEQHASDPRRLGGWDEIGVVDSRVPGSALELFRRHVKEADGG